MFTFIFFIFNPDNSDSYSNMRETNSKQTEEF